MKRLLVVAFLGPTALIPAQPATAQSIQGRFKGGMNFADIPQLSESFEERELWICGSATEWSSEDSRQSA
jgi:hypothetical protein